MLSNPAASASAASPARDRRSPPTTTPRSTLSRSGLRPDGGGRRRQPAGDALEQLQRARGMPRKKAAKVPCRDAKESHGRLRDDARRPRSMVQQGDLTERVAGSQPPAGPPADDDPSGPVKDEEEADARVSLLRQEVARVVRDLLRRAGDRPELLLRQAGEQWHRCQPVHDFAPVHSPVTPSPTLRRILARLGPVARDALRPPTDRRWPRGVRESGSVEAARPLPRRRA